MRLPEQRVAVTLDVDWMPDFVIRYVAKLLLERRVKATWFVTHVSPALEWLREHNDLFELGIHPSFKTGSTHGDDMTEVIDHCVSCVPEAVSARSHGLIQSDYLWRHYLDKTPIRFECSTFIGRVPVAYATRYYWNKRALIRVPFVYQDNMEMVAPDPVWSATQFLKKTAGVQMFNFHPRYIYTNAQTSRGLEAVRQANRSYTELTEADLEPLRNDGIGARTMFLSLIDHLAAIGGGVWAKELDPLETKD